MYMYTCRKGWVAFQWILCVIKILILEEEIKINPHTTSSSSPPNYFIYELFYKSTQRSKTTYTLHQSAFVLYLLRLQMTLSSNAKTFRSPTSLNSHSEAYGAIKHHFEKELKTFVRSLKFTVMLTR